MCIRPTLYSAACPACSLPGLHGTVNVQERRQGCSSVLPPFSTLTRTAVLCRVSLSSTQVLAGFDLWIYVPQQRKHLAPQSAAPHRLRYFQLRLSTFLASPSRPTSSSACFSTPFAPESLKPANRRMSHVGWNHTRQSKWTRLELDRYSQFSDPPELSSNSALPGLDDSATLTFGVTIA